MPKTGRVVRNTSYSLLILVTTVVVGVVASVLTASYLGTNCFESLGFALVFTAILSFFVELLVCSTYSTYKNCNIDYMRQSWESNNAINLCNALLVRDEAPSTRNPSVVI
jgi:Na+-driven multidrug efflux pump